MIELKYIDYDYLNAKHRYFRSSKPPDVDGIKIFDKDDQVEKHKDKKINALQPGHLNQHQEALSTQNSNVLQ